MPDDFPQGFAVCYDPAVPEKIDQLQLDIFDSNKETSEQFLKIDASNPLDQEIIVRASVQKYPNYYVDIPIDLRICGNENIAPVNSIIDLSNLIGSSLSSGISYHGTKVEGMFANDLKGKCDITKYSLYGNQ